MRRLLLPLVLVTLAFPAAAHASVSSSVSGGTLTVTGDASDDQIDVRPGPAGTVLVEDQGFTGVSEVAIRSGAGADEIRLDPLAVAVRVDGEGGVDTVRVRGTDQGEELTLQAVGTHARLAPEFGGLTDLVGVETAQVLAGDGADLVDVGDLSATDLTRLDADLGRFDGAQDSVFVAGTDGNDGIGASMLGDAVRLTGLKADVRVLGETGDRVTVQARGGDDKLTAIGDVPGLTLEGNEGADDLTGGAAAETLRGGPGKDRARGNGGADRIELGADDDAVTLRLTDGADTISGDGGADRLAVQGTAADELVAVDATRVGAASVSGVETVAPAPGSGLDTVAVGDLTGSAITTVAVDLGGLDQRVDTVSVAGTPGPDKVKVAASGAGHTVSGLSATVTVDTIDPGQKILIDGREGDDEIDASTMTKDKTQPFLVGGPGKDLLIGSPGQDVVTGGPGVDVALLIGGLDTFTWAVGDGGDIVEGGAGTDFLRLDGTAAPENISVSPVGGRSRVTVNTELLDLGDLERLDLFPAAGPDSVHVADMSGTDTTHVDVLLTLTRASTVRDGGLDNVRIDGTNGTDKITVTAAGPTVRSAGLAAITTLHFADKVQDRLHIDTELGNDLLSVAPLVHEQVLFSSN